MNYIKHFLSLIIMLIIPFFTDTGLDLLLYKDNERILKARNTLTKREYNQFKENNFQEHEKYKTLHDRLTVIIGITILLLSYYFKLDVWGLSAGGTILILKYIIPKLIELKRGMQFIVAGISIVILTYIVNEYFNKKKI